MTKIKIVSNPYNRSLSYYIFKEQTESWENIKQDSINSRLRENDEEKIFLPFKAHEIIDTIVQEYHAGNEKIELVFEGTEDEFEEIKNICDEEELRDKIHLVRSTRVLENARDILDHAKEIFNTVHPIINNIVKDDSAITSELTKVSDTLKDIIPICIFGNYSSGKSTFINALIGYEILPSGGDPVTAKIYEIKRSGQNDRARIEFSFRDEKYELLFDDKELKIISGSPEKEIIHNIKEKIDTAKKKTLFVMVKAAIEVINSFERRDSSVIEIGNVIKVEVPFSEKGKLGQSHNEFVIFDTPGSNSNTNMDHEQVLMESLKGFSNGIPVWVCVYDSIDSVDNARLCDKLYQIEALDKRFTMIVVNKADSVELPKHGLGSDEISDIMEYESVERMYSSGIYFVSSVMGLGAKNYEGIVSDYLLDVFEEKERKFSDPEARSYKKLYEYNIMPTQIKEEAKRYSADCENLIYANSGVYCVEMEMEQFASKYAAYNKCQMVYVFLKEVISQTGSRIEEKTAILEKEKKKREQELDAKSSELVENIKKATKGLITGFTHDSKTYIHAFAKDQLSYDHTVDELKEMDQSLATENEEEAGFSAYEEEFEGAKANLIKNLKDNSQNLFKGGFVKSVRSLASDWISDTIELYQKKESMDTARQGVDSETSDELLEKIIEEYKEHVVDAQGRLSEEARRQWQQNAEAYREEMIALIAGSDALSEAQRAKISDAILKYEPLEFNDEAEKVFIKAKFLRGNVLGIRLGSSERLDLRRLTSSYNARMKKNIEDLAELLNTNCQNSFLNWQEKLQETIEENITALNPELQEITKSIRLESEIIHELESNQQTISSSFETIETMMGWKELD